MYINHKLLIISDTNDRMRVEARVAKLFRIEIATKLKTIDVGALEELTLRGFDLD